MKVTGVQTYKSLNGSWKNLCPKVAQFCGVYNNVIHRAHSGIEDEEEMEVHEVQRPMGRDGAKKKAATSPILSTSSATGSDELG
ncbi:hypothetical protein Tco_0581662 [Tanacetum coccineum]